MMLGLIKILAVIIGAAAGIVGTVNNVRNSKGHLTKSGIAYISLVLISAFTLVIIDAIKDSQESEFQLGVIDGNSTALRDLSRSLNRIEAIEIEYLLVADWGSEPFRTVSSRMIEQVRSDHFRKMAGVRVPRDMRFTPSFNSFSGSVHFRDWQRRESPLFPSICMSTVYMHVTDSESIEMHREHGSTLYRLDNTHLSIPSHTSCYTSHMKMGRLGAYVYDLDVKMYDGVVEKVGFRSDVIAKPSDSTLWRGDGSVISTLDLLGRDIIFEITLGGFSPNIEIADAIDHISVAYAKIKLGNGLDIELSENDLEHFQTSGGNPAFKFRVPDTIEDLYSRSPISGIDALPAIDAGNQAAISPRATSGN